MKPEISVIVPAYNVEKYIRRAIDSVLKQTYQNFEIIIINDTSTDKTLNLINEYYSNNNKVIIISHEQNQGLGPARNTGISNAQGNYIIFLDSDDWIEPDMLRKLYDTANREQADVVACGVRLAFDDGTYKHYHAHNFKVQGGLKALELLSDYKIGTITWNKLYKKELIDDFNLKFPPIYHEDVTFAMQVAYNCSLYVSITDEFYNYYQSNNSITRKKLTQKHINSYIELYKMMNNFFNEIGLSEIEDGQVLLRKLFKSQTNWILPNIERFYRDTEQIERDKILESEFQRQFSDGFQFVKNSLDYLMHKNGQQENGLQNSGIRKNFYSLIRALKVKIINTIKLF